MTYDFCGIGNSCMDIVDYIDDDFLAHWNFPKSICSYLSLAEADKLESALPNPQYIAGGCAANTASIITALGGKAAFIGRVAKDSIGQMFIDDMHARGIYFPSKPDESEGAGSTRVFALITPDTERTFASYYGVQEDLSAKDLDEESIMHSKFMYLDGYALNSKRGGEAFLKAADIVHQSGGLAVFSPSDISILKNYADVVTKIMAVSDIVVCNEQEAKYIAGCDDLMSAIKILQGMFQTGTVTVGAHGVYAFDKNAVHHIPASTPPSAVTDTNGAGDAFAGGFLFGLSRGYDLPKAAALGNRCASVIITHAGARPIHDYKTFLEE